MTEEFPECEQFRKIPARYRWCICSEGADPEKCAKWRVAWKLPPLGEEWNPSMPARGLGDVVAKVTHAVRLDKAAAFVARAMGKKGGCGCSKRQALLNRVVPFK